MRIANAGVFGLVLLGVGAVACNLNHQSPEQAALDRAYKAGVLNQQEYEGKRAALQSQSKALAALDRAHRAGVLTDDEYRVKTSALLARDTPPVSAATMAADAASVPVQPVAQVSAQTGTPASAPSSYAQGHVLRMKMAKAIDSSGFERPMVSASMLVPTDWQSQGGTTWNIRDKCNTIATTLRASGPDGRGIEIFPSFNWAWADDPTALRATAAQTAQYGSRPCDIMPPMSATDFLRRNLNRYRPNAQLVGFEPAPTLMNLLQQYARKQEQSAAQYNLRQSVRPDVVKARVKYTLNGQAIEEWIIGSTIITGTLGPSMNMRTGQMGQAYSYSCTAYVVGERAPAGQLDSSEKLLEVVAATYRADPQWQARVTNNALAVQKIEQKGISDRSKIVARNSEDIANIRRQAYENQQRSEDHRSEQWSQTMRGVETYRNPETGETIELSNLYGQAWVNNRGEYLLSDQPGFNPSVTFQEEWKPLQRVNQ